MKKVCSCSAVGEQTESRLCIGRATDPQDFQLLNEVREKLEHIVDVYYEAYDLKKPRTKRRTARRDYLKLSKCKKRTAKKLREGVRKQLQYIRLDIGFIVDIIRKTLLKVEEKDANLLNIITTLYEQQLYMYENRIHTVPDRIVSISQPWVRPIVRGKAHANTEFGAKLHISVVDGYAKIERLSFDAYNEATDYFSAVEGYRQEHGCYPQRILVDKIYRNRETIFWCKALGIQLTGPALGRPKKNAERTKQAKKQEHQDICVRNIVEGEFEVGNLNSIHGALLRMNRSMQSEGTYGEIKANRGYERFQRRGINKTILEIALISCGFNMHKYHLSKLEKEKTVKAAGLISQ